MVMEKVFKRFDQPLCIGGGEGWLGNCPGCSRGVYMGDSYITDTWGRYWHAGCKR